MSRKKKEQIHIEPSCGNVFEDLVLSNPEELQLKAKLLYMITEKIKKIDNRKAVAKVLNIGKDQITLLMNRKNK